jgi:hypothetical protein
MEYVFVVFKLRSLSFAPNFDHGAQHLLEEGDLVANIIHV